MLGMALSILHALQQPCEAGLLHVSIWHTSNDSVRGYAGDCVHLQSPSSCPPCHICNLWNYFTNFWLRHQTVSSAKMGSMLDCFATMSPTQWFFFFKRYKVLHISLFSLYCSQANGHKKLVFICFCGGAVGFLFCFVLFFCFVFAMQIPSSPWLLEEDCFLQIQQVWVLSRLDSFPCPPPAS